MRTTTAIRVVDVPSAGSSSMRGIATLMVRLIIAAMIACVTILPWNIGRRNAGRMTKPIMLSGTDLVSHNIPQIIEFVVESFIV